MKALVSTMADWSVQHHVFLHNQQLGCGHSMWTARSLDLSAADIFLWGYLNKRGVSSCFDTTEELNACIHTEIRCISEEMVRASGRHSLKNNLNSNVCTFNEVKETPIVVTNKLLHF
jgi:hypothetical protein